MDERSTEGIEAKAPPYAAPRGKRKAPVRAHFLTPYVFLVPYLVLFVVFVLIPAVFGIWMSLHTWDYFNPVKEWVGLGNYVELFTPGTITHELFWKSMEATGRFTLYSVPLLVVIPLLVALILNQKFRGQNFFRAMYFAPYVLGVAVIGILWRFLLDRNVGYVNYYLGQLGLPDNIAWTSSLPWVWISLVGVTVWWTLGFNAVIYLAGLQDIDPTLYDAAKVDGANRWQRFWHVTLPGLRPVLLFVITITILASANMFGQAYLLTEGGPGEETQTAVMYIAEEGLRNFRMGSASAMSYILAVFLMVISVLNFVLFRRREQ